MRYCHAALSHLLVSKLCLVLGNKKLVYLCCMLITVSTNAAVVGTGQLRASYIVLQSLQGLVELNNMAWQEPAIYQMPADPVLDPKSVFIPSFCPRCLTLTPFQTYTPRACRTQPVPSNGLPRAAVPMMHSRADQSLQHSTRIVYIWVSPHTLQERIAPIYFEAMGFLVLQCQWCISVLKWLQHPALITHIYIGGHQHLTVHNQDCALL